MLYLIYKRLVMRLMWFSTLSSLSVLSRVSHSFSLRGAIKPHLTKDHLHIAKLCRDVYSKDVEELDTFVQSKDTGIQATVTLEGTRAIICFRGSNQLKDWFLNLNMGKVPFLSRKHSDSENKVHSGFFIGHNSVKSKIYTKLKVIVDSGNCESILFCGHSLGSVLSILSAFDYVNPKKIPISVVTFGSPRIGNKTFAENFNKEISCLRIVNDRDVVSVAPFQFMKFYHVGETIQLKQDEVVVGDNTMWERVSWRFRGIFDFDFGIRDHKMPKYIEEIENHLKCK